VPVSFIGGENWSNCRKTTDLYRARKLEFYNTLINNQEEIITLQRRTTIALESLVSTLTDNSLTLSPVIKF
jgi:hypothetical protein